MWGILPFVLGLLHLGRVRVHPLDDRVEKHSKDGNRRSSDAHSRHGRPEHNRGGDDDNDALDGVADALGDGGHRAEDEEGHLIVRVVQKASRCRHLRKLGPRPAGSLDRRKARSPLAVLENSSDGDGVEAGDERHDRKGVGAVHVLALVAAVHGNLGEHRSRPVHQVRQHGSPKAPPRERQLRHRSEPDTRAHRDHGGSNRPGQRDTRDSNADEGSEDRLEGLDHIDKRHGAKRHAHHRRELAAAVEERDHLESLHVRLGRLGDLTDAGCPLRDKPDKPRTELKAGEGEGEGADVEGLLDIDVVSHIQHVPREEVEADERLVDRGLLGAAHPEGGCGGLGGGEERRGGGEESLLVLRGLGVVEGGRGGGGEGEGGKGACGGMPSGQRREPC
mmetsp:Transcript_7542/g.14778  ORF Transcript_7542/g.14778 Transcript_7542/m.14778 type:complete len:391 (+) Transcript_7542:383-1555(+)